MEFKGTKGNWRVVKLDDWFIENDSGKRILCMQHNGLYDYKDMPYNAQLISKAPEILEMLKKHRDYLDSIRHEWEEGERYLYYMTNVLIKEATNI